MVLVKRTRSSKYTESIYSQGLGFRQCYGCGALNTMYVLSLFGEVRCYGYNASRPISEYSSLAAAVPYEKNSDFSVVFLLGKAQVRKQRRFCPQNLGIPEKQI